MSDRFYGWAWLSLAGMWLVSAATRVEWLALLPAAASALHGVLALLDRPMSRSAR